MGRLSERYCSPLHVLDALIARSCSGLNAARLRELALIRRKRDAGSDPFPSGERVRVRGKRSASLHPHPNPLPGGEWRGEGAAPERFRSRWRRRRIFGSRARLRACRRNALARAMRRVQLQDGARGPAYSRYVERAAEGANAADGPLSASASGSKRSSPP